MDQFATTHLRLVADLTGNKLGGEIGSIALRTDLSGGHCAAALREEGRGERGEEDQGVEVVALRGGANDTGDGGTGAAVDPGVPPGQGTHLEVLYQRHRTQE